MFPGKYNVFAILIKKNVALLLDKNIDGNMESKDISFRRQIRNVFKVVLCKEKWPKSGSHLWVCVVLRMGIIRCI